MKNTFVTKSFFALLFTFISLVSFSQEKDIAKVDDLIAKAKETEDPTKRTEYLNKAAQVVMSARLEKDQYVKIGDAFLEAGDEAAAVRYYTRADKEGKSEGYKKVGYFLIEKAVEDPKSEAKTMRKAISYFTKADATAEGYEAVGDVYFNQGEGSYIQAADYYAQGKLEEKVDKVANEFVNKKQPIKAAEVYMKLKSENGYRKAGDLYYGAGDYFHAFTAYETGGIPEGIKKYADRLYENGETMDGDALYSKVAEMYTTKSNYEGLKELAKASEQRGNYQMATTLYEGAGEQQQTSKMRAYTHLYNFEFPEAKAAFEAMGDVETSKAITANQKVLTALSKNAEYLDDVKNNQPPVFYAEDTVTKVKTPNPDDLATLDKYYQEALSNIIDEIYSVSANISQIKNPVIKNVMMTKFKKYKAVRNVLDENFAKKLQKSQATSKDVML